MELVYQCCAGLDVHKKSVSACIRIQQGNQTRVETALFGTFTADLERLRDWLQQHGVQQIAMESTGVFWMPVWNVLERAEGKALELTLINPQHVHALPGRKTDQRDCKRIAELHQYGLLRSSFIPPAAVRELRDLTRRRTHLQGERNRVLNRIRRLLETANLKLGSVVSDISGKTARLIMAEIVRGNCNPEALSDLAQGSLKNKRRELINSLHGFYSDHFRWLLGQALQELRYLDKTLDQVDCQLGKHLQPHAGLIRRLCTIPGVDFTTAAVILAEIGFDMTRFADAAQLASWAGLCPGSNESAGKRFSSRTRKGNRYLRRVLTQSAWSITHKKNCFLTKLFYRVASRGGMKKAAIAVAHRILTISWHIIAEGSAYHESEGNAGGQQTARAARRLARRLEQLGFEVEIKSKTPTEPPRPHASSLPHTAGPTPSPTDPAICRRCARWGIPCIHARNAKLARLATPALLTNQQLR
jgi:transposase